MIKSYVMQIVGFVMLLTGGILGLVGWHWSVVPYVAVVLGLGLGGFGLFHLGAHRIRVIESWTQKESNNE